MFSNLFVRLYLYVHASWRWKWYDENRKIATFVRNRDRGKPEKSEPWRYRGPSSPSNFLRESSSQEVLESLRDLSSWWLVSNQTTSVFRLTKRTRNVPGKTLQARNYNEWSQNSREWKDDAKWAGLVVLELPVRVYICMYVEQNTMQQNVVVSGREG